MRELAAIVLLVLCWLGRQQRLTSPPGWYVNGVDPAGWCEFRPVIGRPGDDIIDAVTRIAIDDDRVIVGRVHCTGGATPRQDGRSVWCQR